MNILLQLYACAIDRGGEFAVSWGLLSRLDALLGDSDKIYVLSLTLEKNCVKQQKLKHVELLEVIGLQKIAYLGKLYYPAWQHLAYQTVLKLGIHFDIIHLYSLSDFRQIGKWYKIKDSYTILGSVGGGQKCPKSLISYDDKSHIVRDFVNFYCKLSPFYQSKVKKYNKSYVCNYET